MLGRDPVMRNCVKMADQNTTTGEKEKNLSEKSPCNDKGETRVFGPDDPELDDLLDSALEDFDLTPGPAMASATQGTLLENPATESSTEKKDEPDVDKDPGQDAMFGEAFDEATAQQAQKEFEAMMQQLMGGDPALMQQFSQLAQAAAGNAPPPPGLAGYTPPSPPNAPDGQAQGPTQGQGPANLFDTIQQTMGGMAQNAESLQGEPSEEELAQMMSGFANFNLGEGDGEDDLNFMPMMQGMMKSLLSKDVLYPSLKEISGKYPAWLEENKGKVEECVYKNYERQYGLMAKITDEFELEKESDLEDVKKKRFEKILDYMQEMQELGHPPKDIVGELPAGMEMDENGMPKFPGGFPGMDPNQQQCSIM